MNQACANPFLYGWFNDNFRSEFNEIAAPLFRCCSSISSIACSGTSSKKMQNLVNQQNPEAEESSGDEGDQDLATREREERQMGDCSCTTTNNILLSTMVNCEITLELPTTTGYAEQRETSEML